MDDRDPELHRALGRIEGQLTAMTEAMVVRDRHYDERLAAHTIRLNGHSAEIDKVKSRQMKTIWSVAGGLAVLQLLISFDFKAIRNLFIG